MRHYRCDNCGREYYSALDPDEMNERGCQCEREDWLTGGGAAAIAWVALVLIVLIILTSLAIGGSR